MEKLRQYPASQGNSWGLDGLRGAGSAGSPQTASAGAGVRAGPSTASAMETDRPAGTLRLGRCPIYFGLLLPPLFTFLLLHIFSSFFPSLSRFPSSLLYFLHGRCFLN